MSSSVQTLGVVGAGTMGRGIAQTAAQSGVSVLLHDVSEQLIGRGVESIRQQLERQVAKGKLAADDAQAALERIRPAPGLEQLRAADFVVEAASENLALKAELFAALDRVCRPEVILASNTSSISITRLGAETQRPQQVIGMHFMNPVPVMKLVEVIRGLATDDATAAATHELARALGKQPVEVRDFPGFVSNRILMPMINEAIFAVYEGVASAADIDTVMKLGMNHPMGPLTLADFIGLDVCLAILEILHDGFGDPKYRPCPLLKQMVAAGRLGKKSGAGFYRYDQP
ncbi:MAG TPA: 3-hydroxybutyryl-CoA dehydrogenase [Acidobacteriota bacterium]|jgi:3-hydroxybutyryl-CoA dehydrogenase